MNSQASAETGKEGRILCLLCQTDSDVFSKNKMTTTAPALFFLVIEPRMFKLCPDQAFEKRLF